jgi:curved DNA-binding protein CbpA
MVISIKNHYATLGVRPEADRREILKARNKLLHRWHPDLNPEYEEQAKEKTLDILLAAEILLDESSRLEYDRIHRNHFQSVSKRKEHRSEVDASTVREFINCPFCDRTNMRSNRNYCMFCGAGIGENAKPFSWNDVDISSSPFDERPSESLLDGLFSSSNIVFFLLAMVCIFVCIRTPSIGMDIWTRASLRFVFLFALLLYAAKYFRE